MTSLDLNRLLRHNTIFSNHFTEFFRDRLPKSSEPTTVYAILKRRPDPRMPKMPDGSTRPGVLPSEWWLDVHISGSDRPRQLKLSTESIVSLTQLGFSVETIMKDMPDLRDLVDRGRAILLTREEVEAHVIKSAEDAKMPLEEYAALLTARENADRRIENAQEDYRSPTSLSPVEDIPKPNAPIVDATLFAESVRPRIMQIGQDISRPDVARRAPENEVLLQIREMKDALTEQEVHYLLTAVPSGTYAQVRKLLLSIASQRLEAELAASKPEAQAPAKAPAKRGRKPKTAPTP